MEVTGADALKPFVIQITGPLIRVVGDKFPWQVRAPPACEQQAGGARRGGARDLGRADWVGREDDGMVGKRRRR